MYSVVLMMALSGGADAIECGRHRGGCAGAAPVACDNCAPVAAPVAVGCAGGSGCNGGGHQGLFQRHHGCDGGNGCNGGGLFGGGLFQRRHGHGGGCNGGAPAGCSGGYAAPVVAPCAGCSASVSGGNVTVAQSAFTIAPVAYTTPARIGAPVVVNSQSAILVARR